MVIVTDNIDSYVEGDQCFEGEMISCACYGTCGC